MLSACFHAFPFAVTAEQLPSQFTFPFHYTPHPLCVHAANELQQYLQQQTAWTSEWKQGKMFGILLVRAHTGEIGFLTAFSGVLAGKNQHPGFVPPVYDLLNPSGFFTAEEAQISAINAQIDELLTADAYVEAQQVPTRLEAAAAHALSTAKAAYQAAKKQRDAMRATTLTHEEEQQLIAESQHQKAALKRLKNEWNERLHVARQQLQPFEAQLQQLKAERKQRSARLQQQLFDQFVLRNANGAQITLTELFAQTPQQVPPAGAAECAAPRLLQYAYLNDLQPLAMAEFWWGNSPKKEIRHQGYFYPSCQHKCAPILAFMLQGLDVEPNPLLMETHKEAELNLVYEDEWLVVIDKPAGMLSVPGKLDHDSVLHRLQRLYPEATGPLLVHRLDMATSGLLLAAKTKAVHQQLQAQFSSRTIKKSYEAVLDGIVTADSGSIELALRPDPQDRPRQVVDPIHGKPAITTYQCLNRKAGQTHIRFYPETGRTHQLRVHAAHAEGLHAPIVGDTLYGKSADRLYLHAAELRFVHPVTGEELILTSPAQFSL